MAKRFVLKAGERVCVLWVFSSSIPGTVRFNAGAPDGQEVTGTVELARRRWFSWIRTSHPLHARNVFDKGYTDTDYRIYVTPDRDCEITFETRHLRAEYYFRFLAAFLILGLIAAITAFVMTLPPPPAGN